MSDYKSKTNAELQALLKSRGLPTTGKKADLITRLTENDSKKAAEPAAASKPVDDEDQIDWDDDADEAEPAKSVEPAPPPTTAPAATETKPKEKKEAALVPAGEGTKSDVQVAEAPKETSAEAATNGEAKPAEPEKPKEKTAEEKEAEAALYRKNMEEVQADAEFEARLARVQKFRPLKEGEKMEDVEEYKAILRQKKFATQEDVKALNSALPEERRRKRGREGDDEGAAQRGGFKNKRFAGRGRSRGGRGGRGGPRGGDRRDQGKPRQEKKEGAGSWMTAEDRKKAEERRAKFGKPVEVKS